MTMPLPYDNFRWLTKSEKKQLEKKLHRGEGKFDLDGGEGYFLEVDLYYPKSLALSHNSFPLAPHNKDISYEDLSPFCQRVASTLKEGKVKNYSTKKFTSTMETRKKYLVHIMNLQYYLKKGLKLQKIHRVIAFRQKAFLKDYINKCTEQRKNAPTKTAANIWKLVVNSTYGKLIEVSNKEKLLKMRLMIKIYFSIYRTMRKRCPSTL